MMTENEDAKVEKATGVVEGGYKTPLEKVRPQDWPSDGRDSTTGISCYWGGEVGISKQFANDKLIRLDKSGSGAAKPSSNSAFGVCWRFP
jgi:hypothetical protein